MKYRIDFDQHLIRVTEANAADSDSNKDQTGRDGRTTQAKPVRQRHQGTGSKAKVGLESKSSAKRSANHKP